MKKDRCRAAGAMLCVLMLLFALCACASEPQPERVSDEELAQLREQYPYNDKTPGVLGQLSEITTGITTFEEYANRETLDTVVALEVIGDWYYLDGSISVYGDEALDAYAPSWASTMEHKVIDAKVEKVLWGNSELQKGDIVTLSFGSTRVSEGRDNESVFLPGERYVCLMQDFYDNIYQKEGLYRASKDYTYYLTEQDVLISVTSILGADDASGMYLDAFERRVIPVMETVHNPPDAEIDDPTPSVETE